MLKLFEKISRTAVATEPFDVLPPAPDGTRGAPRIDPEGCPDGCDDCVSACPTAALTGQGKTLALDLSACLMCGACADTCPEGIEQTSEYAFAMRSEEAEALAAQIREVLGRSLHVRHVDAGSCNGCDWELTHLLNPVYDLQRFGVDFVASPRHADMLLVTGGVTRHLEAALRRTYDAAGEPKLVVAVGTCAVSGGMAGESYASHGGVDKIVPTAVYVPGCPPRPEAILHGILLALGRMTERAERV